jgi:adenosylmethionine-8-amino-7-oxononanoate aminotransferase
MPLFHGTFEPLLFESHRAKPGDIDDIARLLAVREEEVAAVVLEPLVQGAAGMLTHPPGYLRAVRRLCDRHGALLICDEVATGFGRTGTMFACEQEGVSPDLLCVAKGLTGGYMPLAATLATERIYEAFLGDQADFKTFFHGHTTRQPPVCAAALASWTSRTRADTGPHPAQDQAALGVARAGRADARGRRGPSARPDGRHRLGEHDPERDSATGSPSRRGAAA